MLEVRAGDRGELIRALARDRMMLERTVQTVRLQLETASREVFNEGSGGGDHIAVQHLFTQRQSVFVALMGGERLEVALERGAGGQDWRLECAG